MRYTLEIQKLLNRANQENIHPKDAAKLLIEAIQIADANEDIEWGYELREDLMDTQWRLVGREEFVRAFSWMLNTYDADPENYAVEDLLWKYKWIIDELFSNPVVPLEQLDNVLSDYKRRLEEKGYGLRSYYSKLLHEALGQKESVGSKKYLDLVNSLPIDELSDCRACEMDTEVAFLVNEGDFTAAYQKAQPLLQKQYTCAHVPVITLCQLCYLAVKNNENEKAEELFVRAEEELQEREEDSTLIVSIGLLIVFLFHNHKEKGWEYIVKYLPWAMECRTSREFFFSQYMAEALKLEDQEKQVTLELPHEHPLYTSAHTYKVKDLYDFYCKQAQRNAAQFDERNGNSNFSTQLEQALN
ncbi:hypothetical protein [Pedobacter nutrimenti]|uniref:hypothetical protein n=1 Tax=Pedobacter nutrimenti TaxID=1241337 RepID=UPI00292F49CC|nr:hypothetical protein [Pedobacter nutrimenti]